MKMSPGWVRVLIKTIHKTSKYVNLVGVESKEGLFEAVNCVPMRKRALVVSMSSKSIWYARMGHCSHKLLNALSQHIRGIDE